MLTFEFRFNNADEAECVRSAIRRMIPSYRETSKDDGFLLEEFSIKLREFIEKSKAKEADTDPDIPY